MGVLVPINVKVRVVEVNLEGRHENGITTTNTG